MINMEEKNNWMMMTGWSSDQHHPIANEETDNLLSMSLSMFGEDLFPSQDPIDQFFQDMQNDQDFSAGILDSLIGEENNEDDDEDLDETSSDLTSFLDQFEQDLFGSDILSFGMNNSNCGRRSPSGKKRSKKNKKRKSSIHLHSLELDIEVDFDNKKNGKRIRKGSGGSSVICTPSSSAASSPVMKSLLNKDGNSMMMKRLNKKMQDRSMGCKLKKQSGKKKKHGVSLLAKPSLPPKQHGSSSSLLVDRRVLGSSNGLPPANSDLVVRKRGNSETVYEDHCLAMQEEVVLSSSPSSPRNTSSIIIDLNNNNCSNKGRSWTTSNHDKVGKMMNYSKKNSSPLFSSRSSCPATGLVLECQDHDYCPVLLTHDDPFLLP